MRPILRTLFAVALAAESALGATVLRPGTYPKDELPRKTGEPWLCLREKPAQLIECHLTVDPAEKAGAMLVLTPDVPALYLLRGVAGVKTGFVAQGTADDGACVAATVAKKGKVVWSGDLNGDGTNDCLVDIDSPYTSATLQAVLSSSGAFETPAKMAGDKLLEESPEMVRASIFRDGNHEVPNDANLFSYQWMGWKEPDAENAFPQFTGIGSTTTAREQTPPVRPVRRDGKVIEISPWEVFRCDEHEAPAACEKRAKKKLPKPKRVTVYAHGPLGIKRVGPLAVRWEIQRRDEEVRWVRARRVAGTNTIPGETLLLTLNGKETAKNGWKTVLFAPAPVPAGAPKALEELFGAAELSRAEWFFPEKPGTLPAVVRANVIVHSGPMLSRQRVELVVTETGLTTGVPRAFADVDGDGKADLVYADDDYGVWSAGGILLFRAPVGDLGRDDDEH